jgi:BirA family biotin operon repressor/biotin-[acetyl-CoA-carboxylase] ligase
MAILFMGTQIMQFDALESTNATALDMLSKSKPAEGAMVLARHQTAGKGQIGSSWQVAPGMNLTFSLILYPGFLQARQQFELSMAVSLGIHEALGALLPEAGAAVKWPNDVLLEGKKVAGMLIQNSLSGTYIQYAVVGIGLNVNQTEFGPDLPHAGSLAGTAGRAFELEEVLQELLLRLEQRYLQLRAGKSEAIREAYHGVLWGLHQARVYYLPNGQPLPGIIRGTSPEGKLLVETEEGLQAFHNKEIEQRMP